MSITGPKPGLTLKNGATDDAASSAVEASSDSAPSGTFRTRTPSRKRNSGWTVAEQFISDGFHYRVLRKPNDAAQPILTNREADAVELLCTGISNKDIAIQLDVSPSTIGVLLFRAAAKLRARSRPELIAAYHRLRGA
jgi:DNA-binding CsgD family transcriptional regulator